jgi:5-formyltetrahydrofolate cyclo-ligase
VPQDAFRLASTIAGAVRFGRRVSPQEAPSIDLVVFGSVAVAPDGARLGKGEGYGEIEYALLRTAGRVTGEVPIATTVHDVQVVPNVPWEAHDVPVDLIVTPTQIFRTRTRYPKPSQIFWERLTDAKVRAIPLLAQLRGRRITAATGPGC